MALELVMKWVLLSVVNLTALKAGMMAALMASKSAFHWAGSSVLAMDEIGAERMDGGLVECWEIVMADWLVSVVAVTRADYWAVSKACC